MYKEKIKMTAEKIIEELGIKTDVIAIIPYGSQVYGTANKDSDHDFIIVTKGATLPNGAFKTNAISNKDYTIQGVLYSRSGFTNALDNYEIGAWECFSLPKEEYILTTPLFEKFVLVKERKFDEKTMVKKIIQKASASRHVATEQAKTGYSDRAKKGMFHALRILHFGLQIKEHGKIVDFGACNEMYYKFKSIDPEEFDTRDYYDEFAELLEKLRA
jgi:hypothetical protein